MALDRIEPGMILGADLHVAGTMMLPAGAVIAQEHIERLRQLGVTEIVVAASREADLDVARQRLNYLFRRSGTDPTTQALMRVLFEFRLERST